jgi:hypothetical protein
VEALKAINAVLEPVTKLKRLVRVKSVILLKPNRLLSSVEKEVYNILTGIASETLTSDPEKNVSTLYSLAIVEPETYIVLTDNINFWAICNKASKIYHAIVCKNNNIKLYTDKFGLEYLSGVIRTNKLVNKLRLNTLKYVNLQYLYLLLLYVKFKHAKGEKDFDISDKKYLGASGLGLKMLATAHREISYFFLTKSDIMDVFLFSSITHLHLNLKRLLKITNFDVQILSMFASYYNLYRVEQIRLHRQKIKNPTYKLTQYAEVHQITPIVRVSAQSSQEKTLPQSEPELDITNMDTAEAIAAVLRSISW